MEKTDMTQAPAAEGPKPRTSPVQQNGNAAASAGAKAESARLKIIDEAQKMKDKAGARASEYADIGKEKASDALDNLSKLIRDAAASVDQRLGENYGQYARKAADAVSGAATSLREKDLSTVTDDARSLVRKSPVAAIGIAAVAGFMIARMLSSGSNDSQA